MNLLLFGASGMVGQGVLREALAAPDVQRVCCVVRHPLGINHPKLVEWVLPTLALTEADALAQARAAAGPGMVAAEDPLAGFDACFFCLGVSAAGLGEAEYTRWNHDLPLAWCRAWAHSNPGGVLTYVSGAGCDRSEQGRVMWARVKGRTENALLRLPVRQAAMFRPGVIQPLDGIRSLTPAYRWFYTLSAPLLPLLRRLMPHAILSTRSVGRAMLAVARQGHSPPVLETADIARLGAA